MADTKNSGAIRCVIVTPETTGLDTQCRSVSLPLFDGSRGVARGHAPFIGRLGAGEVRVAGEQGGAADTVRSVFVEGGFVEVSHDTVTVITQRAIPAEKVDAAAARAELERVTSTKATGDEALAARQKAADAARALVRAASRGR
jgi:F-type H+-transporting ATPase subunit epsilon